MARKNVDELEKKSGKDSFTSGRTIRKWVEEERKKEITIHSKSRSSDDSKRSKTDSFDYLHIGK